MRELSLVNWSLVSVMTVMVFPLQFRRDTS